MNCGLKKNCCGSYCIVASSDKCCAHEIRIWSKARFVSPNETGGSLPHHLITQRYYCSPCRRYLDQIHQKRVISYYEYGDTSNAVCVGNRIVSASCKTYCRHFCRNEDNETCCCVCKLKANATCPSRKGPRFVKVCDCCLPRLPAQNKSTYRAFSKRTTKATNPTGGKSLPALNYSLEDDLLDDCSGDFLTSEDEAGDEPGQSNSPAEAGSTKKSTPDFTLDGLNWPTIVPDNIQTNGADDEVEQCSLPDSVVILESDLIDNNDRGDEWEVLSNADSVWTWESRDPCRYPRPNSFRDAILSSNTAPSTSTPTSVGSFVTKPFSQKNTTRTVVRSELSDEEGDILAELHDDYKSGRGGKHKWRYKRGQKGNRGNHKMWPSGYYEQSVHRNRKESEKRECRSFVSSLP